MDGSCVLCSCIRTLHATTQNSRTVSVCTCRATILSSIAITAQLYISNPPHSSQEARKDSAHLPLSQSDPWRVSIKLLSNTEKHATWNSFPFTTGSGRALPVADWGFTGLCCTILWSCSLSDDLMQRVFPLYRVTPICKWPLQFGSSVQQHTLACCTERRGVH